MKLQQKSFKLSEVKPIVRFDNKHNKFIQLANNPYAHAFIDEKHDTLHSNRSTSSGKMKLDPFQIRELKIV